MYLDFIKDIAKVGDKIILRCANNTYEGTIVRFTEGMIAIKDDEGKIIVKADSDIDGGVELDNTLNNKEMGSSMTDAPSADSPNVENTIVNQCIDLFDGLYKKSGISIDSLTITNGAISNDVENIAKDEIPIILDTGELVTIKRWCMAGYSQKSCIEGKRVYVCSTPYAATVEMTYEEMRDYFIRSVGNSRTPILHSIQKTLTNTPEFLPYISELKQLKSYFGMLDKEGGKQPDIEQLEKFVTEIVSKEDPKMPLSDAKIRSAYALQFGKKYKTKVIREIRDRLGIPDKLQRTISSPQSTPTIGPKKVQSTCLITKYFASYHNGAASSKEYPEIRFLDDVVEPTLLSELQSFHKWSTPIPAIASVSKIGSYYYASFLAKPTDIEHLKSYSDAFKLDSKTDVANAIDAFIATLDGEYFDEIDEQASKSDQLTYARKQRLIHNYELAETTYLSLLQQDYSLDAVVKELASMYQEIGKLDKAIEIMEHNFDKMVDKQKAYNFISTLYSAAEDTDKALDALRKSVDLSGTKIQKSKVLYNIALLYIKKGDKTQAVNYLEEALKLHRANRGAERLLKIQGVKKLEAKVEKLLRFKESPLIEYDVNNSDVNNVLSETTNEHLLAAKQLKNSNSDKTDEYKHTIIEYAKHKGCDLIKIGNAVSGREYLFAAALNDSNDIENELLYIWSFYPSSQTTVTKEQISDIKSFVENNVPLESNELFYGILRLIATTKVSRQLISAMYQSEIWRPWIFKMLGVEGCEPQEYIDLIQKKAGQENEARIKFMGLFKQMMQENDIKEIFRSLSQMETPAFVSKKDIQFANEAKEIAEKVMDLRKAQTYDNADDITNAIDKKISALSEQIKIYPSEIACCQITLLILKIADICHMHMKQLADSKVPIVSICSICDASIVAPNTCRVQIQVSNMEGRMKILSGSLYLKSVNGKALAPDQYTKVLTDTLQGGGSQYYPFEITISDEEIKNGVLDPLTVGFIYQKNDLSKVTTSQDLQIRISIPEQFVMIPNPYSEFAHANTVEDDTMFKGRETTIQTICDNVVNGKKCYAIYGQKRSGKSSVLFHIAKKLTNEKKALAVHFSLGENIVKDRDNDDTVLINLYYLFLKEIENGLKREDRIVYREVFGHGIKWDDLKDNPEAQFRDRLDLIVDTLHERYQFETYKIVLLIDEYTYLYSFIKQKLLTPLFMTKMKALIENNYFTVVVAGHDALPSFYDEFKNEFRIFEKYKLDYIDEKSARELIEDPIRYEDGSSRYQPGAVDLILKMTACSPFYIQIVCDEIVKYANENKCSPITIPDVNDVYNKLITNQGSISFGDFDNLISSGDGKLNPKAVEDTYRVLQDIAVRTRSQEYCKQKDIYVFGKEDEKIIKDLKERDVVVEDKQYVGEKRIKIKVELFKNWINNNEN